MALKFFKKGGGLSYPVTDYSAGQIGSGGITLGSKTYSWPAFNLVEYSSAGTGPSLPVREGGGGNWDVLYAGQYGSNQYTDLALSYDAAVAAINDFRSGTSDTISSKVASLVAGMSVPGWDWQNANSGYGFWQSVYMYVLVNRFTYEEWEGVGSDPYLAQDPTMFQPGSYFPYWWGPAGYTRPDVQPQPLVPFAELVQNSATYSSDGDPSQQEGTTGNFTYGYPHDIKRLLHLDIRVQGHNPNGGMNYVTFTISPYFSLDKPV